MVEVSVQGSHLVHVVPAIDVKDLTGHETAPFGAKICACSGDLADMAEPPKRYLLYQLFAWLMLVLRPVAHRINCARGDRIRGDAIRPEFTGKRFR